MKHVHLTWYVLADGTHADPNDVAPDKDGVLRHKNGLAVSLHADGTPMSVGKGAAENMNVAAAEAAPASDAEPPKDADASHAKAAPPELNREIKAEPAPKVKPKRGYKAR